MLTRITIIRFKIGDASPANDPIARFIIGLAMMSNDLLRALEDMLELEGDTPEEIGRRVSLFRRQAASIHEAATFITDARRMFPEVSSFIDGLADEARDACDRVIGAVDPSSAHYLGRWLEDHRNVTHHYPKMHPAAAQHGKEEMATALPQPPKSRALSIVASASETRASALPMRSAYSFYPHSTIKPGSKSCGIPPRPSPRSRNAQHSHISTHTQRGPSRSSTTYAALRSLAAPSRRRCASALGPASATC